LSEHDKKPVFEAEVPDELPMEQELRRVEEEERFKNANRRRQESHPRNKPSKGLVLCTRGVGRRRPGIFLLSQTASAS
jgi:hypothetical protein